MDFTGDHSVAILRESTPLDPISTGEHSVIKKFPEIESVIFDIYGTLIISAAGDISLADGTSSDKAMAAAFIEVGLLELISSAEAAVEMYQELIQKQQERGRSRGVEHPEVEIREVWEKLLEHFCGEAVPQDQIEAAAIAYECAANPVWPMPRLKEVLEELRSSVIDSE